MTIELGQDWKLDEYGDIAVAWALEAARLVSGQASVIEDFC